MSHNNRSVVVILSIMSSLIALIYMTYVLSFAPKSCKYRVSIGGIISNDEGNTDSAEPPNADFFADVAIGNVI